MKIKMRYLVPKPQAGGHTLYYWQPKRFFIIKGEKKLCPMKTVSLGSDLVEATTKAQQLNEELDLWRKGQQPIERYIQKDTVAWVMQCYKQDEKYLDLSDGTKKLYGYYFPVINRVFGDLKPCAVQRHHARQFYHAHREQKRKAEIIMQVARIVFQHAVDMGLIAVNPFKEQRVKKAPARQTVWPNDLIEHFKNQAIDMGMPSMALAMQMAYDLGQRPQDLRAMSWNQYTNGRIRLKQQKTNEWVEVKALPTLSALLNACERISPVILICEATGKPYSKDMLSRRFRAICEAADIPDKYQLRDLRRTSVVRLAEAGCTRAEICAITGHSLEDANKILEVYMPRNTAMADAGIAKLESKKLEV